MLVFWGGVFFWRRVFLGGSCVRIVGFVGEWSFGGLGCGGGVDLIGGDDFFVCVLE